MEQSGTQPVGDTQVWPSGQVTPALQKLTHAPEVGSQVSPVGHETPLQIGSTQVIEPAASHVSPLEQPMSPAKQLQGDWHCPAMHDWP